MEKVKKYIVEISGPEGSEAIMSYISSISNAEDLYDYLKDFLDPNNPFHQHAIMDFIHEKFGTAKTPDRGSPSTVRLTGLPLVQNNLNDEDSRMLPKDSAQNTKKTPRNKFVPLLTDTGESRLVPLLPGRIVCNCLATKHSLISNCLSCGRIVCAQEGSGPCVFCGELVCTREEREVLNRNSKKSELLRKQLVKKGPAQGQDQDEKLARAIEHRDRLLASDRDNTRRSNVIDDEMDYFASNTNVWLSPEEKKKVAEKEEQLRSIRHASRRDAKLKYQIDFSGRLIRLEDSSRTEASHQLYSASGEDSLRQSGQEMGKPAMVANPYLPDESPQFVEEVSTKPKPFVDASTRLRKSIDAISSWRLQDQELREMVDEGCCLSMHQPWASLLVRGIKLHEGRSWYSPHRGRLWIAATAKPVDPEDVKELQRFYEDRGMSRTRFPKEYPSGCLLGCVEVVDCLPREAYLQQFPGGESESPFVFICDNPRELLLKLPISGRHKIYKLEKPIHEAAKRAIQAVVAVQ